MKVTPRDVQEVLDAYNMNASAARRLRLNQLTNSQRQAIERSIVRDKAQDWLMEHLTDAAASATIDEDAPAKLAALAGDAAGTAAEHVVADAPAQEG